MSLQESDLDSLLTFSGTPNCESGSVSDSLVGSRKPFSPAGLPHLPCLGSVPSLIVQCHATFGWYPWEACSYLKVNKGEDLGTGNLG